MMDYRAYPTQREAAAMLRISASTLSRKRLAGVRVGRREMRLPAVALLEVARANNWVPVESLASALIDYAQGHCPEAADAVAIQVETWLADLPSQSVLDRETFLAEAARTLPSGLFDAISAYYPSSRAQEVTGTAADQGPAPSATPDGGD